MTNWYPNLNPRVVLAGTRSDLLHACKKVLYLQKFGFSGTAFGDITVFTAQPISSSLSAE